MNKFIRFLIKQIATMLLNPRVWKGFKKIVTLVANEELTGDEKKERAKQLINKEFSRLKDRRVNLGIELAVAYLEFKK